MAFIKYLPIESISPADRVADNDNIIQIHGVHSRVMKLHHELYVELMHRSGPVTRVQREMIATTISSINGCVY